MERQGPPDYLPRELFSRPDFVGACAERDLGAIFAIAVKWGGPGITVSHISRRCEMTITQVQDYVKRGRKAQSLDVIDRVSDGLHIPGRMLRIISRPWEVIEHDRFAVHESQDSSTGQHAVVHGDRDKQESRVPNLVLRRVREQERQETRREFAEALMRAAERLGESISPSERYVARLEDGDVRFPHPVYRRVLSHLCKRPMAELGFASPLSKHGPKPDYEGGSGQEASPDLSPGEGESGSEGILGLMGWLTETNTNDDAISQISRASVYLARAHARMPASKILTEVLQVHRQARILLQSGKQRLRQTRELLRIESDLLAHACLLLGDLGENRKASEYGVAALILAQEAEADEAIAWSVQAKTARWRNRYIEAAEYAARGFEVGALTPTKVELAYREANAIALFGDTARARQALQRAEQTAATLRESGHHDLSVWSFPIERQAVFALSVAIHTGNPDAALRAAAMADSRWAIQDPENPAVWAQIRAGSAIASLMKDSLDKAAEEITPVLDLPQDLRISTVTGYVRQIDARLNEPRFAGSKLAIELRQMISNFSSPVATDCPEGE